MATGLPIREPSPRPRRRPAGFLSAAMSESFRSLPSDTGTSGHGNRTIPDPQRRVFHVEPRAARSAIRAWRQPTATQRHPQEGSCSTWNTAPRRRDELMRLSSSSRPLARQAVFHVEQSRRLVCPITFVADQERGPGQAPGPQDCGSRGDRLAATIDLNGSEAVDPRKTLDTASLCPIDTCQQSSHARAAFSGISTNWNAPNADRVRPIPPQPSGWSENPILYTIRIPDRGRR